MNPKHHARSAYSLLFIFGILSLNSWAANQPESERESAAIRKRFDDQDEIDTSRLALSIRQWNPTARVDLFGSLFTAMRARSVRRLFEDLKSIAVRENDPILLGDLEFCKSDIGLYGTFKLQLAREEGGKLPLSAAFARELGAEVNLAREKALTFYLSADDYLGASFVESEMSYHTEIGMEAQEIDHIRRALEYLAKSKKSPKRSMPGSWWFRLLRGSYEGELRGRLKALDAKQTNGKK